MKLIAPAGISHHIDQNGTQRKVDMNGLLDIGTANPAPFLASGFLMLPQAAGPTASRPTTGLAPGLTYYDTTLAKPIWRNAGNTGWTDATGAAV